MSTDEPVVEDASADVEPPATPDHLTLADFTGLPIMFSTVIFFLATSRWGSYFHIPAVPFYIGDILLTLAIAQVIVLWRQGKLTVRRPDAGVLPLAYVVAALFAWALLRFVTRTSVPMVALRDMAPYTYAVAAFLGYLLPVPDGRRVMIAAYAALTFHATWYIASAHLALSSLPAINREAPIFSTRPDFDSAIFAIAIAFALRQLLSEPRARRSLLGVAIAAFLALNVYAVTTQHSRSGLLATIVAVIAVVVAWLRRGPETDIAEARTAGWAARGGVISAVVLAGILALMFTLPGQRLIDGLDGTNGAAGGTQHARVLVLEGMSHWLTRSPLLTIFGVGYGPNILARSGTLNYLEGGVYENVRAPHNFLLGTWARLGILGVLLVAALLITAGLTAVRRLQSATAPADTLAALIIITIPVVALLGVVLESPFGAIPYFWAIGQLCATASRRDPEAAPPEPEQLASAGAQA